jgi:hypothetical protein
MIQQLLPPLMAGFVLVAIFLWLMRELLKRPSLLRQLELEMHQGGWLGRRLGRAARFRLPVYSAETVHGKEAEFIRDRLPVRWERTLLIMLLAFVLVLAVMWWLTA